MRWLLLALALAAAAIGAAAAWWMRDRLALGDQLAGYRVGQMATYAEAANEIAEIEQSRDPAGLRELVSGWGTGNDRFDYYLARYIVEPRCSDALREAFSRELSWRPGLLARWAHFWSWQVKQPPTEEVKSIQDYLATLLHADPPRKLNWREVLALQAAFVLTGRPEDARRLDTMNWRERSREQEQGSGFGGRGAGKKESEDAAPFDGSTIKRPEAPLPGWRGPVPR